MINTRYEIIKKLGEGRSAVYLCNDIEYPNKQFAIKILPPGVDETERTIFDLSLIVGLGFGIVEFLTYIFVLEVPIIFRISGILFHPASTSIIGYGIAKKKSIQFYFVAVILHLLNNYISLTFTNLDFNPLIGSIFVVLLTIIIAWRLRKETKDDIFI